MAYFVVYNLSINGKRSDPTNVILRNTHPVAWASKPTILSEGITQLVYILFWSEIPDSVVEINEKNNWCCVED